MKRRLLFLFMSLSSLPGFSVSAAIPPPDFRWSSAVADTFIQRFPDPDSIHWVGQTYHFSWQAGYAMFTLEKLWRQTGEPRYFNYIKRYVDQQVDEHGNIPDFVPTALDNFLPGYAILFIYEQTGLEKYRIAATKIRDGFRDYPRNSDGSFWHADWAKHQMWVDGVFMGQMFLARYARPWATASMRSPRSPGR